MMMNEFKIFAYGDRFDVDAFLATTTLHPDYVWHRGDQRRYYACIETKHETSGVEFLLGDGWKVPFLDQEDIAVTYLKAHRDELRGLANFPCVDTFILGLQYICKVKDDSAFGFCIRPSPQLMWHALDTGVWPHYYVEFDRTYWDAQVDELRRRVAELECLQKGAPAKQRKRKSR
jgi:hypothetical protein